MERVIPILLTVLFVSPFYAAEPLIDPQQLAADEASEKLESDCEIEFREKQNMECKYFLIQGDNLWPIPRRGTHRYCQEKYASLSVSDLETEFKKIEDVYEQARYFPIGSSLEPERGEITKGDLSSEIRCISDYIQLKK